MTRSRSPIVVLTVTVVTLTCAACTQANRSPSTSAAQATQTTPPTIGAVAYDAARKVVVLTTAGPARNATVMETWTWDGRLWTRQRPAVSPPTRSETVLAYDELRHVTILHGGLAGSGNLDDTWEWDGAAWSERHPAHVPPAVAPGRDPGSMVYNPVTHHVLLYQEPQQLWSWDGEDWIELQPAHLPTDLSGRLTYDGKHVILVGAEVWAWTASDWISVSRHVPELAPIEPITFDSGAGKALMYGGGPGDDTWTWNGSSWSREHPKHSPAGSWPPQLVDDRALNRVIAFAAGDYQAQISGIYAWDGIDWSAFGVSSPPTAAAGRGVMPVADAAATIRRTVTHTSPALLPRFPAGVTDAQVAADDVTFSLKAWSDDRSIEITLGIVVPGNSNLGAENRTIIFRGGSAYYQYIAGDPTSWRSIWWTERPGFSRSDFGLKNPGGIPYALSATGLTETEFFALGNSLR